MNIKKTKAWKNAEWRYVEIFNAPMSPFPGERLSPNEIIERFEDIIEECPKFYPALLGLALIKFGNEIVTFEESGLDDAFYLMLELAEPKQLEEEVDALISNLEGILRYDLSKHFLEILVDRFPQNAQFQDGLTYAALRTGDNDLALLHNTKAIEIEPDNPNFIGNQGFIHLVFGNLKKAGAALKKASELDPENKVVQGNLEIQRYLTKHGGNYFDYLLRPSEKAEIERLANEEEWERVNELCSSYNSGRMEALLITSLQQDNYEKSRVHNISNALKEFFEFVQQINQDGYMLYEDISFIHENFKAIMHKFIFKFRDMNRTVMDDIYESLAVYYGFLASRNIVAVKEFERFRKDIQKMKKELVDKMQKYNAIRHNDNMTDDEKEDIRDELFDGDHAWPFL